MDAVGSGLDGQTRLSDATGPNQRDEARSGSVEQGGNQLELGLAIDEVGRLGGEVVRDGLDRPERWDAEASPSALTW
jgi:hypothetical protein